MDTTLYRVRVMVIHQDPQDFIPPRIINVNNTKLVELNCLAKASGTFRLTIIKTIFINPHGEGQVRKTADSTVNKLIKSLKKLQPCIN